MRSYLFFILFTGLFFCAGHLMAQDGKKELSGTSLLQKRDSPVLKTKASDSSLTKKDTVLPRKDTIKKHDPRVATRRSLIIPGWGQAYNRDYWKIPIVYGILAIPAGFYFYNNSYYKKTKFAYEARFKAAANAADTADIALIDPELTNLSISSLQNYRNSFRRDRDYSILWFLLAWGLQVADATVFAHLKQFDVSSDLSMEVNPSFNPYTRMPGLSLSLNLKSPTRREPITR